MNIKTAKSNLLKLKTKLVQYEYEYYVLDEPSVTDYEYDQDLKALIEIEKEYPDLITQDSPSHRVGGTIAAKFNKVKHINPMMSLGNIFNIEGLNKFNDDMLKNVATNKTLSYVVEPKIDGLGISLIYENSYLSRAVTRGDGVFGEDVTANVKTIKSIPLKIDDKFSNEIIEIRGEIYLSKTDFININESLDGVKNFANPRNAAAGTLRNLDSSIVATRNLKAFLYYIPEAIKLNLHTHYEALQWLKENGFSTAKIITYAKTLADVKKQIEHLTNVRNDLDYQIDGIVIKVNEFELYDEIGYTSKFPKWAIAYKFPATISQTKLLDIITTVGRTGRISYVAKLEPVLLDGSTISSATLHNAEFIAEKDIMINDYINIYKAGDVIPYVMGVVTNKRSKNLVPWTPPTICPECNQALIKPKGEVDQRCVNEVCPARIIGTLIYFCSRVAMNVEGLSSSIITKLYGAHIITTIADIYRIEQKSYEILNGNFLIKEKSFRKLTDAINVTKQNSCERLLTGLGIRHIGNNVAKVLAKYFKSIDNIRLATYEELISVNEVGDKMAESIINFFQNNANLKTIEELKELGLNTYYKQTLDAQVLDQISLFEDDSNNKVVKISEVNKKYMHKSFVITGSFSISRNVIKQILEEIYLCKVSSTITKKTDYLLSGLNSGSKLAKAETFKISIITDEFWKN